MRAVMADNINSVCKAAASALEALSNLQPGFANNISGRLSRNGNTAAANTPTASRSTSIQSRLQSCFPTIAAAGVAPGTSRIGRTTVPARRGRKQTAPRRGGRTKKVIVHKDLVVIPSPDTETVPTHATRVTVEERQLVCHEFPFNKEWTEEIIKEKILAQFPKLIAFEYVKV